MNMQFLTRFLLLLLYSYVSCIRLSGHETTNPFRLFARIGPSQGFYVQNTNAYIRALSGIRTHGHSVWAIQDVYVLDSAATGTGFSVKKTNNWSRGSSSV
jgi:hypothetical protein